MKEGGHYDDVDESQLPYIQLKILGSGGCSIVDKVEDRNKRRVFARKTFALKRSQRSWMIKTFKNETQIFRSLGKHHHIVQLFATYTTDGCLAMIMSPVADGGDLDKFLDDFNEHRDNPLQFQVHMEMKSVLERAFG
jgi:serine/threonine protein kinase